MPAAPPAEAPTQTRSFRSLRAAQYDARALFHVRSRHRPGSSGPTAPARGSCSSWRRRPSPPGGRGASARSSTGRTHARTWTTTSGPSARADLARNHPAIRAALHEGIDDADYITTVKVLHQLIRNAGGTVA
ncbi:hypothetical protein AB0B78_28740 [Streptomyces sp. NPDC040724]|uniref:hypothetical protein n=1 Tax=Streptomyces sp. NPDC040724 TaxID=3155612 RepID=UPI003408D72D